jgi:hypothetical protein
MEIQQNTLSIDKNDSLTTPIKQLNVFDINSTALKEKALTVKSSRAPFTPTRSGRDSILQDSSISEAGIG